MMGFHFGAKTVLAKSFEFFGLPSSFRHDGSITYIIDLWAIWKDTK